MRGTNDIPLGVKLPLTITIIHHVETGKATDSAYEQSMGQVQLAKRIWRQSLSQLLITTGSQLVVSQYVSVPRTVRVFRQKFALDDAIAFPAFAPLEALPCM